MYHFVSDPAKNDQGFQGIPLDHFEEQIAKLARRFEPLTHDDLKACAATGGPLPDNGFHLSFDDGFRDHIDNVFPVLKRLGLSASFFPVTEPLADGTVSVIEKQRHLQYAAFGDYKDFLMEFAKTASKMLPARGTEEFLPSDENLAWAADYKPHLNFYSLAERFYRKTRDQRLTGPEFAEIIDRLFAEAVASEADFIAGYYMSFGDLRDLLAAGMTVGGHSHTHPLFPDIPEAQQRREISKCLDILEVELGAPVDSFAYPYGEPTSAAAAFLGEMGMPYVLAVGNQMAETDVDRLAIPRVDAADFDTVSSAWGPE